MQAVLDALAKQPVGIAHLRRSSPGYVRVMEYDRLPKKGSIEQVFGKRYKAVIILYEMHTTKHRRVDGTGHYICILKRGAGSYEYFSSYGLPPLAEMDATKSDDRLKSLLGSKLLVNRAKLQSKFHSATCGRWAFCRALLANLPLAQFVGFFGKKVQLNKADSLIGLATIFAIR